MAAPPALPTVRMMSRMALPLGSRLLAGMLGLERPVRWARVSGVLSPLFPTLNSDEAAFLDLAVIRANNPSLTLARMVRELGRLGLAAIVVEGQVDNAAIREAERSNLPLFALPEGSDPQRAARNVIRLISDREAQEEAQAAALFRHLSQGVASGLGLGGLVKQLHLLAGHAVQVRNPAGDLLAHAGNAPAQSSELSFPLVAGDITLGQLTLRDGAAALDDWTRIALEQGAAALTLELSKMEAVDAAREGAQGGFVSALLTNEEEAVLVARARAADYALDAAQWAVVIVTDTKQVEENVVHAWQRRAAAHAEKLGWQVRAAVTQEGSAGLTTMPEIEHPQWRITLLISGGSVLWESSRNQFLDYLRQVWNETSPLSLAAGDPGRGMEGLRRSLAQAQDALSLGLRLFGGGRCYLHRDMGLYRLLRHLQGTDDLRSFLDDTLSLLEAYDREHSTELLATLDVLLAHGGNISATAKAMHLHRNSLIYRLERIRDIASLDPAKPEDAFALRLALMLAPLR